MFISYEAWKKSNFSHIKGRKKEKLKVRTEINEIEYRKQNISVKPKASTFSQFVQEQMRRYKLSISRIKDKTPLYILQIVKE